MLLNAYLNAPQLQGNPSFLTNLQPGGAGTTIAGNTGTPYLPYPKTESMQLEMLDVTQAAGNAAPAPLGSLMVANLVAANTGGVLFTLSNQFQQVLTAGMFGVVYKPGYNDPITELPVGSGTEGIITFQGFALALCETSNGTAIAPGTLLCADGIGNLTAIAAPSTPAAPTVTPIGGSATAYSYAVVAVSASGTYSAISANGSTAAGVATLTNAAYNIITWTELPDATGGYIILRTASSGTPSTVGAIGRVPAGATGYFLDTGLPIVPGTTATQAFALPTAPGAPTVVQIAGATAGTTSNTYTVAAIGYGGVWSAASTGTALTTSNAVLSPTNANKITWTPVTGATSYIIQRSAANSKNQNGVALTTGNIGFATPAQATSGFLDVGQTAVTYTQITTPPALPGNGVAAAVSLGTLAGSTATPTLVPVIVGGV